MDAKKIFDNSRESFIYMERYVNNGSPSGWTQKRTTSDKTSPFKGEKFFSLIEFETGNMSSKVIGEKNNILDNINLCHPDSISFKSDVICGNTNYKVSSIKVEPTSSGRTMLVVSKDYDGFIKLTYDVHRLGRIDRQLKFDHCMSSYEVSDYFKQTIDANKFNNRFSILLEKTGKVTYIPYKNGYYEWGVMLREFYPYPYSYENRVLVPGFSLFGKDFYSAETSSDKPLIIQFIELSNSNPKEYLLDLLKITIDGWFETLLNCAFILELHSQNCYYEIDSTYHIKRIVVKDMESVDKDITLAKRFGLKIEWKSFPYKCFYEDNPVNHPWYYHIRPSFMYDFKMGVYLLSPIIKTVCSYFNLNEKEIESRVKEYVNTKYIPLLPNGYFPTDDCWYDCDDSERKPGEEKKYNAHPNPIFR